MNKRELNIRLFIYKSSVTYCCKHVFYTIYGDFTFYADKIKSENGLKLKELEFLRHKCLKNWSRKYCSKSSKTIYR